MAASFFFYDLETSGFNPRVQRVMQFAGQRTDMNLKPIGNPYNVILKLTPDVVPDPDAILVTGITPQATLADGITEEAFLKVFQKEICTADTILLGYNSVRFDDEFMRFMLYRNFYDAYEWQWQNGCSRWDLLDVIRMTRALRPEGINWPVDDKGRATNRLELITSQNDLDHANAHDALSDVQALIAAAQLVKSKQPKLFDYLLKMRSKQAVKTLVTAGQPFLYTSGKYPSEYEKTTIAVLLAERPDGQGALVYDLRQDPTEFVKLSPKELAARWRYDPDSDKARLPVKTLKYNRCPAVATTDVLAKDKQTTLDRLKLDLSAINMNAKTLQATPDFTKNVLAALAELDQADQRGRGEESGVDGRLYDGFFDDNDKKLMRQVSAADQNNISTLEPQFHDDRLKQLLPLYKARNFPSLLTEEERRNWDDFCKDRLLAGGDRSHLTHYFQRLAELANNTALDANKRFLLEELQLYGESIVPTDAV